MVRCSLVLVYVSVSKFSNLDSVWEKSGISDGVLKSVTSVLSDRNSVVSRVAGPGTLDNPACCRVPDPVTPW